MRSAKPRIKGKAQLGFVWSTCVCKHLPWAGLNSSLCVDRLENRASSIHDYRFVSRDDVLLKPCAVLSQAMHWISDDQDGKLGQAKEAGQPIRNCLNRWHTTTIHDCESQKCKLVQAVNRECGGTRRQAQITTEIEILNLRVCFSARRPVRHHRAGLK